MAVRSKAWVYGRSLAETAGPNPAGGLDVCFLLLLYFVRLRSLCRTDHWSRGVPDRDVSGCDREASVIRRPWSNRDCSFTEGKKYRSYIQTYHLALFLILFL